MTSTSEKLHLIIESLLLASETPLSKKQIVAAFSEGNQPSEDHITESLQKLSDSCAERSYELIQIASGYRLQLRTEFSPWIQKLKEKKPPRYGRAFLETLALIAYKQPITRAEIEEVRGVGVGSNIIRTLQERQWIRVIGHREIPGRPALLATTHKFLDYFNLKNLNELPPLSEIRNFNNIKDDILENQLETHEELVTFKNTKSDVKNTSLETSENSLKNSLFTDLDLLESQLPDNFDQLIKKKISSTPHSESKKNNH